MERSASESRQRVLHFGLIAEQQYTLNAFGQSCDLRPHSAATISPFPELQTEVGQSVTHFATITQPADVIQLIRVYGPADADGIRPLESMAVSTPSDTGVYGNADIAKALLFLHPGLTVLTAEHAPAVLSHISDSKGFRQMIAILDALASQKKPWNQAVKLKDRSGNYLRKADGSYVYEYRLAQDVESQRSAIALDAKRRVFGDLTLRNVRWQELDGVANINISPDRRVSAVRAVSNASGYKIKIQDPGPLYGISAEVLELTDDFTLKLRLHNSYVRHASVYISFIGGDGKTAIPVSAQGWLACLLEDIAPVWIDLITQNLTPDGSPILDRTHQINFLGIIGAETTFLGIPVSEAATDFAFKLPQVGPQTISKVRILCGSLGLHTDNEWDPTAAIIGMALTAFFDLALPTFALIATVGLPSDKLFESFFKSTDAIKFWAKVVIEIFFVIKDSIDNPDMAGEDVKDFLIDLGESLVDQVLSASDVVAKLAAFFATEEVAEAVPIVGWAIKAELIEATIEQLAQTVGEIAGSPRIVEFDVTITMDAKFTLYPGEKGGLSVTQRPLHHHCPVQ
jgi:hypothetical protein